MTFSTDFLVYETPRFCRFFGIVNTFCVCGEEEEKNQRKPLFHIRVNLSKKSLLHFVRILYFAFIVPENSFEKKKQEPKRLLFCR